MWFSNSVGFTIQLLNHAVARSLERNVPDAVKTMTVLHGQIIGYLAEASDKEIYQRDVEKVFSIGRSTVAKVLKLMEKKGLIIRKEAPQDARLKTLELTPESIRLNKNYIEHLHWVDEHLMQGLSKDEIKVFFEISAKIRCNAELLGVEEQ